MNCSTCGDPITIREARYLPGDATRQAPLCPVCNQDFQLGRLFNAQRHEVAPFVRRLLFELYHPLGERQMRELAAPLAEFARHVERALEGMWRKP